MIDPSDIPNDKRREKAKYWFSIITDWEKSKLTKARYCELNKINASTFYYWFHYLQGQSTHPHSGGKSQLKNRSKERKSKFIAVEITKEPPLANKYTEISSGLKIILPGGLLLSLEKNFEPGRLIQLLKLLEPLCL